MMDATTRIVSAEVGRALACGGPVVALESTLVAHGLPWPENLETARQAEDQVRRAGAIAATIAVLGGRVRVGLSEAELEHLARPGTFLKAGRRDLAVAVARGLDAATTVSATLWVARLCRIGVMATGGLGGVHRDATTTGDVSNDLEERARADGTVVVCSGVKTILDVPATLEALETRGVAVVGIKPGRFPPLPRPPAAWRSRSRSNPPSRPRRWPGPIAGSACRGRSPWPSRCPPLLRWTPT